MHISGLVHSLKIPFKIKVSPEIVIDRFVNLFIIAGKHITLIDTGVSGSEKVVFEYLQSIGRKPSEIKTILLTHTHPDHIGSVKTIQELTNCKVYVHAAEQMWLEHIEQQEKERSVPGFQNMVAGSCKADKLLNGNDVLELENDITIEVIHCPGHSLGSVAYLFKQQNALFSGDIIPVKNDVPIYDNYQQSIKSLEKLENMPYPNYLLSSWDEPKLGDEVELAISDGFEQLYSVYAAWLEAKKSNSDFCEPDIAIKVLQNIGMPSKFVNPLFLRAIKSHTIK